MVNKIIGFILAVLVPVVNVFTFPFTGFSGPSSFESGKDSGYIKGVCHPSEDYELIHESNIEWIRVDATYPFDENGEISLYYQYFKNWIRQYVDNGFKVFLVTPNPNEFLQHGLDIRNEADYEAIMDVARFYMEDLRGLVSGYQVANEMGVDRFTAPFTMEEAAYFVGETMKAMYPLAQDEIIGYNLGGMGFLTLTFKMLKYNKYCDYVGVDLYLGSFENIVKNIDIYFAAMNLIRLVTRKPLIMTEFGYIGYGEPKSDEEKREILRKYGFESLDEVKQDVNTFISRLPEGLKKEFETIYADRSDEEKFDLLFNGEFSNHIFCELREGTGLYGYKHSPEGQAKFYKYLIPKLRSLSWCAGSFIYMWNDTDHCYVCGQSDCPVETGWGIVDGQGNPKPAFYEVKEAFR